MSDDEAIDLYDRAGAADRGAFPGVRWPDVLITTENLERLTEGVLASRLDLAQAAFGHDFSEEACAGRLEEAWRTDELQARFAPEGVYVRAAFTIRVKLSDDEGGDCGDAASRAAGEGGACEETLRIAAEICLSFVERRHTRPFIDFMGGEVRRAGDDTIRVIDPFAMMVGPADAVAWGLNGGAGG